MDFDSNNSSAPDRHSPTNAPVDSPWDSQHIHHSPSNQNHEERDPRSPPAYALQSRRSQHLLGDGGLARRPSKRTHRSRERPIAIRKRSSASDLHRSSSWTDGRLHNYISTNFQDDVRHIQPPRSPPRSSPGHHVPASTHNCHEFDLALRQVNHQPRHDERQATNQHVNECQVPIPSSSQTDNAPQSRQTTTHILDASTVVIPAQAIPTIPECNDGDGSTYPGGILEVDEGYCETDDSLSWLEASIGSGTPESRLARHRVMLKYRRSHEAAMQCPTVVRNVPRMRRRRRKETDRRRRSLAASEASDMALLRTPSPATIPT